MIFKTQHTFLDKTNFNSCPDIFIATIWLKMSARMEAPQSGQHISDILLKCYFDTILKQSFSTNVHILSECMQPTLLLIIFIETPQWFRKSGCHGAQGLSKVSFHNAVGCNVFFQSQQGCLSTDSYDLTQNKQIKTKIG